MNVSQNTEIPVKWAYESPAKHTHRTSGWTLVDNEVNHEMVLECPRCGAMWHTGIPASDDFFDIDDLAAAAAEWLRAELLGKVTRRQLPLPLVIVDAPIRDLPKRKYTRHALIDSSMQMPLALAA